jgi:hypothetical protein
MQCYQPVEITLGFISFFVVFGFLYFCFVLRICLVFFIFAADLIIDMSAVRPRGK